MANELKIGSPGLVTVAGADVFCEQLTRSPMSSGDANYREALLQTLIERTPSILPVQEFLPATLALLSLGTEIPVDIGGKTGYIDNLLVTNEGRLVLVETKLWNNPESTREVVAQVLQYGMALSALSLRELEAKLKLASSQTVRDFAVGHGGLPGMVEDFDDAMERFLRRGELLYLIVADGIRYSVERLAHWLDEGNSAPFKFGLVELKFFDAGQDKLFVVPRALVKSREVSRHVVIVDVRGATPGTTTASVIDESKPAKGSQSLTQRPVKVEGPPLTREALIAAVKERAGDAAATSVSRLQDLLAASGLDSKSTASTIQWGTLAGTDETSFHSLITFTVTGPWSHPTFATIDTIGDDEFVAHKQRMNTVAGFYRPEHATDPSKRRHELIPSYKTLIGKEDELVQAVCKTRDVLAHSLAGS